MVLKKAVLVAISALFIGGCGMTLNRKSIIPTGVAKDANHLVTKLKNLEMGISVQEAKSRLGIVSKTPGITDLVKPDEKQKAMYGSASIIGSPSDMEQFRKLLETRDIIEVTFKDTVRKLDSTNGYSALVSQSGPDLTAYLIFENNMLTKVIVPDNFQKHEKTTYFLTEILAEAAVNAAKKGR